MSLLITTLLMLINISASAREKSPVLGTFSLIDLWLLTCTIFVAMALFEYAIVIKIRYSSRDQVSTGEHNQHVEFKGHNRCTKVRKNRTMPRSMVKRECRFLCRSLTGSLSTCFLHALH